MPATSCTASSLKVQLRGLCPHSIQGGLFVNQKYPEAQAPRLTHIPVCPIMAHQSLSSWAAGCAAVPGWATQPDLMYHLE